MSKSQKLDECLENLRNTVLERPVVSVLKVGQDLTASVILVASLFLIDLTVGTFISNSLAM